MLLPVRGLSADVQLSVPLQGPEANLRRDNPCHEPLRGRKHDRTAAILP